MSSVRYCGAGGSTEASPPPTPPPQQSKPPKPPRTLRVQGQSQADQVRTSLSREGTPPDGAVRGMPSASASSSAAAEVPNDGSSGYPPVPSAGPLPLSGRRAAASAAQSVLGAQSGSGSVASSAFGTASSVATGSAAPSSSSTRTPSTEPGARLSSAGSDRVGQVRPARHVGGSGGTVDAPVRWKWQPSLTSDDQRLRYSGVGSSHLKGRRSNLAKIREIQGLPPSPSTAVTAGGLGSARRTTK